MRGRTPRLDRRTRERLVAIREQGFAVQDEEVAAGLRSVSVPVFGREAAGGRGINIAVASSGTMSPRCGDRCSIDCANGRRHLRATALGLASHVVIPRAEQLLVTAGQPEHRFPTLRHLDVRSETSFNDPPGDCDSATRRLE